MGIVMLVVTLHLPTRPKRERKKKKVGLSTEEHTTRDTTMETLMASGTVLACK